MFTDPMRPVATGIPGCESQITGKMDVRNRLMFPTNPTIAVAVNRPIRNEKVVQATYSSGPLGRLQAQHVLMLVGHYREEEKAQQS